MSASDAAVRYDHGYPRELILTPLGREFADAFDKNDHEAMSQIVERWRDLATKIQEEEK